MGCNHVFDRSVTGGPMKKRLIVFFIFTISSTSLFAINPNPLISKFKPIYASFTGSPTPLVNGKFGETAWAVKDSSWIALKLETGFTGIFFTWNSTNFMWSDSIGTPGICTEGLPVPEDYLLLISNNSTNGIDGTWLTADSISGNIAAARGHSIDFTGSSWIKMLVTKGSGKIDEIEVFDISNGNDDTWLFIGTSITATAFKRPVPFKDFRYYIMDYVKDFNPRATPAFIRGGIGCLKSDGLAADIKKVLQMSGGVKHCAIEIGTYDAEGGSPDNVKKFTANLQKCIDECRAQQVEPVIARIPATIPDKASWQVHEEYLTAIDGLVKKNKLKPGPDLYTWFSQHPEELKNDGILPNQRGGMSILRLWAEAVWMLYKNTPDEKTN